MHTSSSRLSTFLWVYVLFVLLEGCRSGTTVAERLPPRRYTPFPFATLTPTPSPVAARAYYEEGLARQRIGNLTGALASFASALRLQPDMAQAYIARGSVYLARGEYARALADARSARRIDPEDATACILEGEALLRMGRGRSALEAFDCALTLDPKRRDETFSSRWLAARSAHDSERLTMLSQEYARAHPDDPLRYYYAGWASLERGEARAAVAMLVAGIAQSPDAPALLWFTLGQAYLAIPAAHEAVISLEAARALVEIGDQSLSLHSEQPIVDLFGMLGRAYLAAGRCVDAETMLKYAREVAGVPTDYDAFLPAAVLCQTPTPPPTPYPTVTPWEW